MTKKAQLERFSAPFEIRAEPGQKLQGILRGVASVFNEPVFEAGMPTIIPRGAFADTLNSGRNIPVLWMHKLSVPIGVITRAYEAEHGLVVEIKLSKVPAAKRALRLIRDGVLRGLSIGFIPSKISYEQRNGEKVRILNKVDMWELSIVTIPKDPGANVDSVRNQEPNPLELRLAEAMQSIERLDAAIAKLGQDFAAALALKLDREMTKETEQVKEEPVAEPPKEDFRPFEALRKLEDFQREMQLDSSN